MPDERDGSTRFRPLVGLGGLSAALILGGGLSARADVTPDTSATSLGTQVVTPGNCSTSCVMTIEGGTTSTAGNNLFHRFQNFDTRTNGSQGSPAISGVLFNNAPTVSNLIVGVLNPTRITVPINLANKANLFWLSPNGITIDSGGSFSNATSLILSSATGLRFSNGSIEQVFDAVTTDQSAASAISSTPITDRAGLVTDPANPLLAINPNLFRDIVLDGGLLTVDQSLLIDAQSGSVFINDGSRIVGPGSSTSSPLVQGGNVTLAGAGVALSAGLASTEIDVQGSTGGITIQGGTIGTLSVGVSLNGGTLKTSSGPINISGVDDQIGKGVELNGSTVQSATGGISLQGVANPINSGSAAGLSILNASQVTTGGAITLNGSANGYSIGGGGNDGQPSSPLPPHVGIDIAGSQILSTGGTTSATGNAESSTNDPVIGLAVRDDLLGNPSSITAASPLTLTSQQGGIQIAGQISGGSSVLVDSTQGVNLASGGSISASGSGDALIVSSGIGAFANAAGSSAFSVSGGGRWLLYAHSTLDTSTGGLPFAFKQYAITLAEPAATVLGSGNGLLYAISPSVSASLVDVSKVYDGTTAALLSPTNVLVNGAIDGDAVVVGTSNGQYSSAGTSPITAAGAEDVGINKLVSASGSILSATSSSAQGSVPVYGYQLATANLGSETAEITPRPLSVTAIAPVAATYGTPAPTGAVSFSGLIRGDLVSSGTASLVNPTFSSSSNLRAGSYQQAATTLSGDDAGNYSLTPFTTATANYVVSPLALAIGTAEPVSTIYGSTPPGGAVAFTNLISGDLVSATSSVVAPQLSGSGNLRVGSYQQTITDLSGTDAGNYSLTPFTTANPSLTVTPRPLTAGSIAAVTTAYGSPSPSGAVSFTDLIAGDAVFGQAEILNPAFSSSSNLRAGSYQQAATTLSGDDAGNYSLTPFTTATANYVVSPLALAIGTAEPVSTIYGSTPPGGAVAFTNLISGDLVSATSSVVAPQLSGSGNLRVGSYQQTITGLSGTDAGNYSLTPFTTANPSLTVTPRPLTAGSIAAVTTAYGSPSPSGAVAFTDLISGDLVSATSSVVAPQLSGSGNLRVGSYQQTITGLSGTDAGNYSLTPFTTANPSLTVTPRPLTAGSIAAVTTAYGSPSPSGAVAFTDLIAGDAVFGQAEILNPALSSSSNLRADSYQQRVSSISGADAGNYSLTPFTTATANYVVSPLALNLTIKTNPKVYDGTTNASLTVPATPTGVLAGDAVSLSASGSFNDRNIGTDKPVSFNISTAGADAVNYRFLAPTDARGTIMIRDLAVWQSSSGGDWSVASNWDALPDGDNVAAVLIPAGSGPVRFDAAVGATNLQTLTNQGSLTVEAPGLSVGRIVNSGTLSLATDLGLRGFGGQLTYSQSAGRLDGAGTLSLLSGSSSWTGGLWSGDGQVLLAPGSTLTIAGSQWGGRTLVVQGGSREQAAASLTISGSSTAIAGNNTIFNAGRTTLSNANLNEDGGSLTLQNSGELVASGSNSLAGTFSHSGGSLTVTSGSLALSAAGSDSGGSYQISDGAELVWSGGSRSLLGGTAYGSSGSGLFRLAGANLTAAAGTPLRFDGQLQVDSGSINGSDSLAIIGGYRQSGGLLSGFNAVVIDQRSGALQISGTSRDQASIITAPGGSIQLTAAAGAIELSNTGLNARGDTSGGTITLTGTSTSSSATAVNLNNVSLRTSATSTGPATSGGAITINGVPTASEATPQPAAVTIKGSLIEADPPGQGGAITINGNNIAVQSSALNVLGSSGGALQIGSSSTTALNLADSTTVVLGPGASQSFQVAPGGMLINSAQVSYPLGPPANTPTSADSSSSSSSSQTSSSWVAESVAALALQPLSQPPLPANNSTGATPNSNTSSPVFGPMVTNEPQLTATAELKLDVAIGFENVTSSETTASGLSAAAASAGNSGTTDPGNSDSSAGAGISGLGAAAPTTLTSSETRINFLEGEAQAQRDTADKLGLAQATTSEAPTPEQLQSVMQGVQAWLKEQERQRRCRRDGTAPCRP